MLGPRAGNNQDPSLDGKQHLTNQSQPLGTMWELQRIPVLVCTTGLSKDYLSAISADI